MSPSQDRQRDTDTRRRLDALMRARPWIESQRDYDRIWRIIARAAVIDQAELRKAETEKLDRLASLVGAYDAGYSHALYEGAKLDAIGVEAELRNAEGGGLTNAEFAARLGMKSSGTVRKYRVAGEIFAWKKDQRSFRYPAWQIYRGRLLPGLKDVLAALGAKHLARLSLVSFFVYRSEELGNKSPLELLREKQVEQVLEHAKRYGDIGA